jgi:hypothetical protein
MEERNKQESNAEIIFSYEFGKVSQTLLNLNTLLHPQSDLYDKIIHLGKGAGLLTNLSTNKNPSDWHKKEIEKLEEKWYEVYNAVCDEYFEKTYSYPVEMEKKYINAVEELIEAGKVKKFHLEAMQDMVNHSLKEYYPSNDKIQNLKEKAAKVMIELEDRSEDSFVTKQEARKMLQIVDQCVFLQPRQRERESLGR